MCMGKPLKPEHDGMVFVDSGFEAFFIGKSRHANVLPVEANVHVITLPCAPRVASSNRGHYGGLWREAAAILAARAAARSLCDLVAQCRRNDK